MVLAFGGCGYWNAIQYLISFFVYKRTHAVIDILTGRLVLILRSFIVQVYKEKLKFLSLIRDHRHKKK